MARKSQKTEIIVTDRLKVVKVDSLNWQIFEYREIEDRPGAKRAGERDWCGLPCYFSSLKYAMLRLLDVDIAMSGEGMTLEDAIKRIERCERKIAKSVADAK